LTSYKERIKLNLICASSLSYLLGQGQVRPFGQEILDARSTTYGRQNLDVTSDLGRFYRI